MLAPIAVVGPRITNENPYKERKRYQLAKRRKKKKLPPPTLEKNKEHIDIRA